MEGTPRSYQSVRLRPISIAHLGEPLLVANGDSLVNDHESNDGLHPRYPRKKGRVTRGNVSAYRVFRAHFLTRNNRLF